MKDTPGAFAKTMIAASMVVTLGAAPLRVFGRECLRYEITAIIPGPYCSGWGYSPVFARGLSNHETPWVTGFCSECVVGPEKAFVWPGAGNVQPLVFPAAGPNTYAYDVTDSGWVVGAFAPAGAGGWRGFIYDVANGSITQLNPAVSNGGCIALAANSAGLVVGSRTISSTAYNAFVYQNGKYIDLGVMNGPYSEAWAVSEKGSVTGWTGTAQSQVGNRAFLMSQGAIFILPLLENGTAAEGWAINVLDEVAGWARFNLPNGASRTRAAVWRNGAIVNLGVLSGYRHSVAMGISGDGRSIVGVSAVSDNGQSQDQACLWRDDAIFNLNALIPASPGFLLTNAYAINERGEILCEANVVPYGAVAVILRPIPASIGDITGDCKVNVSDLLLVINEWGKSKSIADINNDGIVNIYDLLLVIKHWDTS